MTANKCNHNFLNMKEIVIEIETMGPYYEDIVRRFQFEGYHVQTINADSTAVT